MPRLSSSWQSNSTNRTSSAIKSTFVGELKLLGINNDIAPASSRRLHTGHDFVIGRDHNKCQWAIDDPQLSATHLRVYTIVYNDEDEGSTTNLVFAEDVSRNGTYWNGSLIGKGNGGFLLSHDDRLRLSAKTVLRFVMPEDGGLGDFFDLQQETEMTRFRQDYVVTDRLLGAGAFGQVFMAIEQRTRTQVACKMVDLRKFNHMKSKHFAGTRVPVTGGHTKQNGQVQMIKIWAQQQRKGTELEERLKSCYREVEILSKLSHPNIISIDKVYVTDNTIYMFEDLVAAGDLFSYLQSKNGRLLEVEAAVIIRQILKALQYLHDRNIVHRDLKPENVMMTSLSAGCRVILTDFGAARQLGFRRRMTSLVGTREYAAPEIKPSTIDGTFQAGYTKAVDMWSVGAITVVLLTGGTAFRDPLTGGFSSVLARTGNLKYLQESRDWLSVRPRPQTFVINLLNLADEQRMTVQQALEHDWFSNQTHKLAFEELYQRTVKNWFPRIAKTPVVEFVGSDVVQHLAISRPLTSQWKRPRHGEHPVEPPYKPFPRNMYIELWPRHKPSGLGMSDKVKAAIADIWTGKPRKPAHRFRPHSVPSRSGAIGFPSKSLDLTSQKLERTDNNQVSGKENPFPVTTTLPSVLATSVRGDNVAVRRRRESIMSKGGVLDRASSISEPRSIRATSVHSYLNPFTNGFPANTRSRRLSRSSSNVVATATVNKRLRGSVFDIWTDGDGDSSDTDDDEICWRNAKRQRSLPVKATKDLELHTSTTKAHNYRAALTEDLWEEQSSLYLPRI